MSKTRQELETMANEWMEDRSAITILDASGDPTCTPQSAFIAGYLKAQEEFIIWASQAWDDGYNAGRSWNEAVSETKEDA